MHISSGALAFAEREEGYVGHVYFDVAGVATIGYGHTGPDVFRIGHLTQPQAAALLRRDFAERYEPPVQDLIHRGARPSQGMFDALCDMSYNCGPGSVDASSAIGRLMIAGHTSAVPAHILQWDKARVGGVLVVVEGLRERRLADVAMFVSDVAPRPREPYAHLSRHERFLCESIDAYSRHPGRHARALRRLRAEATAQRKLVWRRAQPRPRGDGRGWDHLHRRERYRALLARTT